ncbi:MAG: phage head-tail joining protein [Paracoccaceae bacterium]
MSYTQSHLDALREAYASGVTEVSYDGKTVKYRSLAELATAITTVAATLGQGPATRQHYPRFSKGL